MAEKQSSKPVRLVKRILAINKEAELGVYAGYATLFILMAAVPLLMLVITAVNLAPHFSTEDFTDLLLKVLPDLAQVKALILTVVQNLNNQTSGILAGIAALTTLWSASAGVTAIQKGLMKVTPGAKSTIMDKPKSLLYTFLFTIILIAMLVFQVLGNSIQQILTAVIAKFGFEDVVGRVSSILQVSSILTVVLIILVLCLAYRYLPGGTRTLKSQLPGAIFTTLLWVGFSLLFAFFIPRFWKASNIYGSLASIFLVTMWLRFIITILLFGAALNRALQEEKAEAAPEVEAAPAVKAVEAEAAPVKATEAPEASPQIEAAPAEEPTPETPAAPAAEAPVEEAPAPTAEPAGPGPVIQVAAAAACTLPFLAAAMSNAKKQEAAAKTGKARKKAKNDDTIKNAKAAIAAAKKASAMVKKLRG
ncbi:MAG: YihY/virulence factor BrkB family protein [Eubacterium sp.]|nr:YihY/virulence factor BrkB family protein [Eubacterium sp.]